jgi:SAM-dependent methyltransferase
MKIHTNGFWLNTTTEGHVNDLSLRTALLEILQKEQVTSVLDLGCGPGFYLQAFKSAGYDCAGYDGNPNTVQLTEGLAQVADLSKKFELNRKYDCVVSLEVGEHIPEEYEPAFIENLCRHADKWLIVSWAIPNQHGDGHVNCRTNSYVENILNKKGFVRVTDYGEQLRNSADCHWFKNTLMVFRRD